MSTLHKGARVAFRRDIFSPWEIGTLDAATLNEHNLLFGIWENDNEYVGEITLNGLFWDIHEMSPDNPWCGDIVSREEFAEWVSEGYVSSYDGQGFYYDGEYEYMPVDADNAENVICPVYANFPYVIWYNK